MSYNLSVVNIIPDVHLKTMNELAPHYGRGEQMFSVKLDDDAGNIFWGCHDGSWTQEEYDAFKTTPPPSEITGAAEALAALYERVVLDGVPMDNWQAALAELGLSVVEESQT